MTSSSTGDVPSLLPNFRDFLCVCILFCHHFLQHGRSTRACTLAARIGFSDASFSIARTNKPQPTGTHTSLHACRWHCSFFRRSSGPIPGCFLHRYLGPIPGCFSFFTSIWHVFHQTFFSPPGWELSRASSSLLVNLLLTPWLTPSRSALLPSPVAIGSVSCSKHALQDASSALLQAIGTDTNGCLRRACSSSRSSRLHEPPAMALSPRISGVGSCEPSSVTSHVFRRPCHKPSLAAPPEWSATCVTSLHSFLCATVRHCTFFHVLPYAPGAVVCSPLSSLSRSAGPPARLSELTLLDTQFHVLRADCWCCSAALNPSARCAWCH